MAIRTVIDSCVLRNALEGKGEVHRKALEVLDDSNREFMAVDFVALELIPKPIFQKFQDQAVFYQSFFDNAPLHIEVTSDITKLALKLASEHDIGPMDSLIVSSAIISGADEFITTEKPTKPMHKVKEIKITSLYTPSS
jgi:predicted nucleic acid-binding protein